MGGKTHDYLLYIDGIYSLSYSYILSSQDNYNALPHTQILQRLILSQKKGEEQ